MGIKAWIDRTGQNAVINHEIKDWDASGIQLYGSRMLSGKNPGFDIDLSPERLLRVIDIRLDDWRGSSDDKLDVVGKTNIQDIRDGDKLKFSDEQGNRITLVVNSVVVFANTMQLGLKYV